nr:hypothetical membrane protein [uncultured archaeon]
MGNMVEDLGSVIKKGFNTWKANLCISLPILFSSIITAIVALIIIGSAILAAVPSLPVIFHIEVGHFYRKRKHM